MLHMDTCSEACEQSRVSMASLECLLTMVCRCTWACEGKKTQASTCFALKYPHQAKHSQNRHGQHAASFPMRNGILNVFGSPAGHIHAKDCKIQP